MAALGCAPTIRSTSRPALNTRRAGMLRTLKRSAVTGFSSTFNFPTRRRPRFSAASCSIAGAIILHGPHHGAHISSSTGSGERTTSAEKLASVIVSGAEEITSGVLHRPHTGCRPCSIFSRGTRLFAPQLEQRISSVSVMWVPVMTAEFIVPHALVSEDGVHGRNPSAPCMWAAPGPDQCTSGASSARRSPDSDFGSNITVAVGTTIADRPPHRSVRARLRTRLLPWMSGGEANMRIGMQNTRLGNPPVQDGEQTPPSHLGALTATNENI